MSSGTSYQRFVRFLRDAVFAYMFDLLGIASGLLVAWQLDIFELSRWTYVVYPAILSARGVVTGIMSGRLSTALNIGTVHPRLRGNTSLFYSIRDSVDVATFETSIMMGLLAGVVGGAVLNLETSDYLDIFLVIVATMAFGIVISIVTIFGAFISFRRQLDPDITTYPMTSSIADIVITGAYIIVLNLFFTQGAAGKMIVYGLAAAFTIEAIYLVKKNRREPEFIKTLKESALTLFLVSVIVNLTGSTLGKISEYVGSRKEVYTVYPALIDTVGDIGAVIGSTLTTKLALFSIKPTLLSIRHHRLEIAAAWLASAIMFVAYSLVSLASQSRLELFGPFTLMLLLVNLLAGSAVVLVSVMSAIMTFRRGLDPDNFVIPLESSLADTLTSLSLLLALHVFG